MVREVFKFKESCVDGLAGALSLSLIGQELFGGSARRVSRSGRGQEYVAN